MQNKLKVSFLALACMVSLAACSGSNSGGSGDASGGGVKPDEIAEVKHPLFMDELGVVPTKGSYLININNLSKKNYTLDSIKITDARGNDKSSLLSVSGQLCKRLVANGSCSIEFSPKAVKSETLLMTVNLRDSKNELSTLHRVVRISDDLKGSSGVSFATELGEVVTEAGDYRITIPVVLNESFTDVKAFNGSLSCASGSFKKGSTCTYRISGHALGDHTTVSANIKGYRADGSVVEQTDNLDVRIATMPDLVLSQGVKLVADGKTEVPIVIYNDGNFAADGIKYTTTLPNGKINNVSSCGEIEAGKMCEIGVTADSETNGSGRVTAAYTYDGEDYKRGTNVSYKGTTDIGLLIKTDSGSFEGVIAGETGTITISLENNGKNELTDIKANLVNVGTGMKITDNKCPTTLKFGENCVIEAEYKPTATEAGTAQLFVTAKYKGEQGQTNAYSSRHDIAYNATDSQNVLSITSPRNMKIDGNGADTDTQTVELFRTDSGNIGLSLDKIELNKKVSALSIDSASSCLLPNTDLTSANPKCDIKLDFGPLQPSNGFMLETGVTVDVDYTFGTTNSQKISSSAFDVQAGTASANVVLDRIEPAGSPLHIKGDGSEKNPYDFLALSTSDKLKLTYTFKNKGTAKATNVNVGAGTEDLVFPYGVKVDSNTCGRGGTETVALDSGKECQLVIEAPDEDIFHDVAHSSSGLPIQNGALELPLSINYSDENGSYEDEEASRYVRFTRNWANVSYSDTKVTKLSNAWHIEFKATVNPLDAKYYPIDIEVLKTANNHLDQAENIKKCNITGSTGTADTCDLGFDLPFASYPDSGDLLVETELKSATLDAKDRLRANYELKYSDTPAQVEVTKKWPTPKFDNVISHGAEERLPFEVKFTNVEPSQKAEISIQNKLTSQVKAAIDKDTCETLQAKGDCTVGGYVTMPTLLTMQPAQYDFDLKIKLPKNADQELTLSELGQYVQTFNKKARPHALTGIFEGDNSFAPLNPSARGVGFMVKKDSTLIEGPLKLNGAATQADSYNIVKIMATNLTTSQAAEITLYAGMMGNGSAMAMFGSLPTCSAGCNQYLTLRSEIFSNNNTSAYLNLANNQYQISNKEDDLNLNKNLPAGHYVATFYFIRNSQPVKIDLDWNKK